MRNTYSLLREEIWRRGRGKIYFISDFASFDTHKVLQGCFLDLERGGFLIRIAQGIYMYPKINPKTGDEIMYPSVEEIAKKIAKKRKIRIIPAGAYALEVLGLSTHTSGNIVFMTDGSNRRLKIKESGRTILFRNVAPICLAYKSDELMMVVCVLKEMGEGNVTKEVLEKIKSALPDEVREYLSSDLKYAPTWIRKVIYQLFSSKPDAPIGREENELPVR